MALLTNKIADFSFIALHGTVEPPREMVELDQRAGINGTEVTLTGTKGRPFQMVSQTDAGTYAEAKQLYLDYLDLIAAGPVILVQGGVSSFTQGFKVKVLNVTAVRISRLSSSIGGLTSNPQGYIECVWDLISISN